MPLVLSITQTASNVPLLLAAVLKSVMCQNITGMRSNIFNAGNWECVQEDVNFPHVYHNTTTRNFTHIHILTNTILVLLKWRSVWWMWTVTSELIWEMLTSFLPWRYTRYIQVDLHWHNLDPKLHSYCMDYSTSEHKTITGQRNVAMKRVHNFSFVLNDKIIQNIQPTDLAVTTAPNCTIPNACSISCLHLYDMSCLVAYRNKGIICCLILESVICY
jgi:hypothetical protein